MTIILGILLAVAATGQLVPTSAVARISTASSGITGVSTHALDSSPDTQTILTLPASGSRDKTSRISKPIALQASLQQPTVINP